METQSLWWSLRRHTVPALLTLLVVAALAVAAAYTPKNQYSASTTLSVTPVTAGSPNPAYAAFLIPTLQAQATSRQLRATVRQKLGARVGNASWTVSTSLEPGTGVVHLSATSRDQDIVAPAANATADALRAAQPATGPLTVAVIDPATLPSAPSSPARLVVLLSGLGIGVILAMFVAMLAGGRSRRRAAARDADQHTVSTLPADGRHAPQPLVREPRTPAGQAEPVSAAGRASSHR